MPEVGCVISKGRSAMDAEFPDREVHYKVLFQNTLKNTNKGCTSSNHSSTNSNSASFTFSKKQTVCQDAETIVSALLGAFNENICGLILPI